MQLLHVVATPRTTTSQTLPIAEAYIDRLRETQDDLHVGVLDLFHADLPAVAGANIDTKYSLMVGRPIDPAHRESWAAIEALIADFVAADVVVLTAPMWNFSIPYALKYYIDCLVQPGYAFRYGEGGVPEPLMHGKRMACMTSRGGDYGPDSPMHLLDFEEPYLRAIFGFIGVVDIEFVHAQPMDLSPGLRARAHEAAIERARALADRVGLVAS